MNNLLEKKLNYQELAKETRKDVLEMLYQKKAPHVGSCFSMVELMVALYFKELSIDPEKPNEPNRDRLVLSKGHGCPVLYSVLARRGFFSRELLSNFNVNGGVISGHPNYDVMRGIEITSGSLGHGLSIGAGMAMAAEKDKRNSRVFVYLGDGELDEGSSWEAVLFANHHKLDNLIAIVDYNKLQILGKVCDVLELEPLADKWRAFGWSAKEIDGHNFEQIFKAFEEIPFIKNKPSVIIAHTVKGKGVSFMENELCWHDKYPNEEEYKRAMEELS